MKIGITLKKNAYTPEAFAYNDFLLSRGHDIQLEYILDPNNDVNIFFMGVIPFWIKRKGKAIEIHEYQSLSIPPYSKIKDITKKTINRIPNGRIFLNNVVYDNIHFKSKVPYILRDMGVDEQLFQKPGVNPDFDIIYAGSINGRVGLVDVILKLSKRFKIVVVGEIESDLRLLFEKNNITLVGRVDRSTLKDLYANAKFGLNYTPDIYPFNLQTSTKTLEYLASGLNIISNRYNWIESFFNEINYSPIWLEDVWNENQFQDYKCKRLPNMEEYKWENILINCKFEEFIKDLHKKNKD